MHRKGTVSGQGLGQHLPLPEQGRRNTQWVLRCTQSPASVHTVHRVCPVEDAQHCAHSLQGQSEVEGWGQESEVSRTVDTGDLMNPNPGCHPPHLKEGRPQPHPMPHPPELGPPTGQEGVEGTLLGGSQPGAA